MRITFRQALNDLSENIENDCPICMNRTHDSYLEECSNILEELVDKVEPKIVIVEKDNDVFGSIWECYTCPICEEELLTKCEEIIMFLPYNRKTKYCPKCGQCLDWENINYE